MRKNKKVEPVPSVESVESFFDITTFPVIYGGHTAHRVAQCAVVKHEVYRSVVSFYNDRGEEFMFAIADHCDPLFSGFVDHRLFSARRDEDGSVVLDILCDTGQVEKKLGHWSFRDVWQNFGRGRGSEPRTFRDVTAAMVEYGSRDVRVSLLARGVVIFSATRDYDEGEFFRLFGRMEEATEK